MSEPIRANPGVGNCQPAQVAGFDALAELALDLRWSWNHYADEVWQLDPELWSLTHNPWAVLQIVSRDRLKALAEPNFRQKIEDLARAKRKVAGAPAWFQKLHTPSPLTCVAYFSMEFMLSEALPIYSGGLGNVLEQEVVPEFYNRDGNGIPAAWIARMRESMARLTPRFSANRAMRQYTQQYYLPAASAYRERAADQGALGARIVGWRRALEEQWSGLRFGEVRIQSAGSKHTFEVQLFLGEISPEAMRLELYADGGNGNAPVRQEIKRERRITSSANGYAYSGSVPANRPATDYTPRVVPYHPGVTVPLEANCILWQR